ncbi:GDSL-type esterase/lipase family protein [Abditibacterium utsteinense]|nr:GDSL-type esterase/lipase family protein [Abditibacterium utsteinense]
MKKRNATQCQRFASVLAANALMMGVFTCGFGGNSPVLAQQAAQTMGAVPADKPYASEINEFWEADKKQMPPVGAVLFMGSSSIRIWDTLARDFAEIPVINRGFGGSFIEESTRYADRIAIPYQPKIIVLAAGTNDLAYGNKNSQQVFQEFKDFVAKIHARLPETRIVYVSINPTVARWKQESEILEANHLIEKWIFENNSPTQKLNFVNSHAQILTPDGQPQPQLLKEDGLHFNAQGYKVWTSILKPRIMALAAIDGVQRLDAPQPRLRQEH